MYVCMYVCMYQGRKYELQIGGALNFDRVLNAQSKGFIMKEISSTVGRNLVHCRQKSAVKSRNPL